MVSFKDLRFCKIKKGTKKPYEEDWPNKPYNWDEMQEHILKERNYGVLCGYCGLIIIDADSKEVRDAVEKELPATFKVETGSKGFHYYFICKEIKKKIVLQTPERHYGEVQGPGAQCVGPGCYSEDTKILTTDGFKGIDEISKEDKVATINPAGIIEYHIPINIFKYDYKGNMINFGSRSINLLVTPNHRMYYKKYFSNKSYSFELAENLINKEFRIKRNGNWIGEDLDWFYPLIPKEVFRKNCKREIAYQMFMDGSSIEDIAKLFNNKIETVEDYIRKIKQRNREGRKRKRIDTTTKIIEKIKMDDWLDFFGWWISEGFTVKEKKSNFTIGISQAKYKQEVFKSIQKIGFNPQHKQKINSFVFRSKQLWEYLRPFGGSFEKHIPYEIKNLPPKKLKILLNSLIKGDGSFINNKKNGKDWKRYYTVSKRLAEDIIEILIKCGYSATLRYEEREVMLPSKKKKLSKMYVINISKSNCSKITKSKNVEYNGRVWCLEVPNNNLFVLRDGKTAWCGNSIHPTGNTYNIINDVDIVEVSKEQLFAVLKPYMKDVAEQEAKALDELKDFDKKYGDSDINSINITSVISMGGFKRANNGEYYGANPWHGSTTGMNFWINPSKNIAKCWRCDCGLNVAKVIALTEGIISGANCYGKLSKDEFLKVLDVAQQKYGLVKPEDPFITLKAASKRRLKKVVDTFFDKGDLARQIYEAQPYFYDSVKNWWLWNDVDKCWIRRDETDILNMVSEHSTADTIKSKDRVEILEAMKQEGRRKIPKPVKYSWIQFKDIIVDAEDGTKLKACPSYFITNPTPWRLPEDGSEDTPNMDRIFREWVGEDNVLLLYQILAFCLLPDYPINRLFCFIGPGLNGKSKYLELLTNFIGRNNVTSTELDILLESRFEISRLHKKLVCQMGETNFAEMSKTSIIKKLTGGDLIGFEYKGKDPFDDKNYAKILISTNNLPTTTDKTIGFYRRWLIIDFPNQFTEKKDILKDIPEEEYNALANKCVKILKALLVDRKFHNEGTVEDRQKKFEDKSNPFDKFWKENVEEDGSAFIWKYEFERRFNDWCKDHRFREFSETAIGIKMKERGMDTIRREADWFTDGIKKSLRAWAGITWKKPHEKEDAGKQ